jgi:hypothetical protein
MKSSVGNLNLDVNKPVTLMVYTSGLTISKKGNYVEEKWLLERKRAHQAPYYCR